MLLILPGAVVVVVKEWSKSAIAGGAKIVCVPELNIR
jgi:hypothetical protein